MISTSGILLYFSNAAYQNKVTPLPSCRNAIPALQQCFNVVRKLFNDRSTMRILTVTLLLTFSLVSTAQSELMGTYGDYFGNQIQLNSDSTFKYTWNFDLQSSWTKGTWTMAKDTIYFKMIPVFDTLRYTESKNTAFDKLILSVDEKPERLLSIDVGVLLSYGQNYHSYPDKLFFRKGRLYKINSGRLITKKQKGFWTEKKWRPWYVKITN